MKKFKTTVKFSGEYDLVVKANNEVEAKEAFEEIANHSYATPYTLEYDSWLDHPEVDDYAETYCDFEVESYKVEEVKN